MTHIKPYFCVWKHVFLHNCLSNEEKLSNHCFKHHSSTFNTLSFHQFIAHKSFEWIGIVFSYWMDFLYFADGILQIYEKIKWSTKWKKWFQNQLRHITHNFITVMRNNESCTGKNLRALHTNVQSTLIKYISTGICEPIKTFSFDCIHFEWNWNSMHGFVIELCFTGLLVYVLCSLPCYRMIAVVFVISSTSFSQKCPLRHIKSLYRWAIVFECVWLLWH